MRKEYAEERPIPANAKTLANPDGEGYSIFNQSNWDPARLSNKVGDLGES